MNYPLLDNILEPEKLKSLSISELEELADEIRNKIIATLADLGGHLSSNLGIVELTLALHKSFSSPFDKFIFDTGHQTYAHKMLTGRNKAFHTLRQFKGLSSFPNPEESPHDHFVSGHAGTALSLALGMAKNRDLTKRTEHIIPILGDASLTCGLTLEALNNIPENLERFIIILNDNKMSISPNVGNIQKCLDLLCVDSPSQKAKMEMKEASCGKGSFMEMKEAIRDKSSFMAMKEASCGKSSFFETFNLQYIGPVDGHDLKTMIELFASLKDQKKPTIVHLLTKKGQGMEVAEKEPTLYHGVRPFNQQSGKFLPLEKPPFSQIFGKTILQMAEKDPSLVAITAATAEGSFLAPFRREFPERCLDVGIAEGHAVTFAGGLAYGGKMKVVVSLYSSFLQRSFDNLFHDVCLQKLPVLFAIDRSGISGPDGSTHHGIYDIGFLNAMPNMVIAQPRNGRLLKELLQSAFSWERPTAIRYPNLPTDDALVEQKREVGCAEILMRGKKLLIIALGHMCDLALQVGEELKKEKIEATILDPIFIKPLDGDLLYDLLSTHNFVVTIEEHSLNFGFGSIFNNFTIRNGFNSLQILNLGIPDTFLQHGSNSSLLKELELDLNHVVEKIKQHFSLKSLNNKIEVEQLNLGEKR